MMKSLSRVGLGLSLVFGCLFLALLAEFYYLLWWKKRHNIIANEQDNCHFTSQRDLSQLFHTWKKASSCSNIKALCNSSSTTDSIKRSNNFLNPFGEENLPGPPTFLFTITEETKEDLEESEDQRKNNTLSDLLHVFETPILTPLPSPPYFTPPSRSPSPNNINGRDSFNEFKYSSPSPKFKFLRDAELKHIRRRELMEEV